MSSDVIISETPNLVELPAIPRVSRISFSGFPYQEELKSILIVSEMNRREEQMPALPDSPIMRFPSSISAKNARASSVIDSELAALMQKTLLTEASTNRRESVILPSNNSNNANSTKFLTTLSASKDKALPPLPPLKSQKKPPELKGLNKELLIKRPVSPPLVPSTTSPSSLRARPRSGSLPLLNEFTISESNSVLLRSTRENSLLRSSNGSSDSSKDKSSSGSPDFPNDKSRSYSTSSSSSSEKSVSRKNSWSKIRNFYRQTKAGGVATIYSSRSLTSLNSNSNQSSQSVATAPSQLPKELTISGPMHLAPPILTSKRLQNSDSPRMPPLNEDSSPSQASQSSSLLQPSFPRPKKKVPPPLNKPTLDDSFRRVPQKSFTKKLGERYSIVNSISTPISAISGKTGVQVYPQSHPRKVSTTFVTKDPKSPIEPTHTIPSDLSNATDKLRPVNSSEDSSLPPSVSNLFVPSIEKSQGASLIYPPISPGLITSPRTSSKGLPQGTSILEASEKYDPATLQKMILMGIKESKNFRVLLLKEMEDLSQEIPILHKRIRELSVIYNKESRIREGAAALVQLHAQKSNKKAMKEANAVLMAASLRIEGVTTDLWQVSERLTNVRQKMLEHIAAILGIGMKKFDDGYKTLLAKVREAQINIDKQKNWEHESARIEMEKIELEKREKEHIRVRSLLFPTSSEQSPDVKKETKEQNEMVTPTSEETERISYLEDRINTLKTELASMHVQLDDARAEIGSKEQENIELKNQLNQGTEIATRLLDQRQDPDFLIECSGPSLSSTETQNRPDSIAIFQFPKPPQNFPEVQQSPEEDLPMLEKLCKLEIHMSNYESRVQALLEKKISTKHGDLHATLGARLSQVLNIDESRQSNDSVPTSPDEQTVDSIQESKTIREICSQEYIDTMKELRALFHELPDSEKTNDLVRASDMPVKEFTTDCLLERMRSLIQSHHTLSTNVTDLEHLTSQLQSQLTFSQTEKAQMENNVKQLSEKIEMAQRESERLQVTVRRLSTVGFDGQSTKDVDIRDHFQKQMEQQEQEFFGKLTEKDTAMKSLEQELEVTKNRVCTLEKTIGELNGMVKERDGRVQALLFAESGVLATTGSSDSNECSNEDYNEDEDGQSSKIAVSRELSWDYVKEYTFLETPPERDNMKDVTTEEHTEGPIGDK